MNHPPASLRVEDRFVDRRSTQATATWFYASLGGQIACQLALLVPAFSSVRVLLRVAAFGISLAFLTLVPGRSRGLGVLRTLLATCLGVLALSGLNPEGGGPLAAAAHFTFHVAILAPVFWGSRIEISAKELERVVLLLWAFSAASAAVGVLQAQFPGRFQPSLATLLAERGAGYVSTMSIQLASGAWIPRPMGLTDVPGGASVGGFYAILLGVGVLLANPFKGARWVSVVAMVAGMTCVYLSQVRALLIMLGICLVALLLVLLFAGRLGRSFGIFLVGAGILIVGFGVAFALGGASVTNRLETLTRDSPATVYYNSRGIFLEHTFVSLLGEHPLGAGLGRWGMMNNYFGDKARSIWVEIQWTGWLLDGGIALLLLYPAAVLAATWQAVRVARRHSANRLGVWAAIVAAYDVGAIALTFSYPFFMSATGLEFWLLNAALIAAATREEGAPDQSTAERPS